MTDKYCAFQYGTLSPWNFIEDQFLITKEEAQNLWDKYLPKFKEDLIDGKEPEMALWVEMNSDSDYHTAEKHYHFEDFRVVDGEICEIKRL